MFFYYHFYSIMKTTFKEETKEENSGSTTDQEGVTESGNISEVTIDSVISCMKEATKLIRIAPHIIVMFMVYNITNSGSSDTTLSVYWFNIK